MFTLFVCLISLIVGATFAGPIKAATGRAYAWLILKFDQWRD